MTRAKIRILYGEVMSDSDIARLRASLATFSSIEHIDDELRAFIADHLPDIAARLPAPTPDPGPMEITAEMFPDLAPHAVAGMVPDNAARCYWVETPEGRVRAEIGDSVGFGFDGIHHVVKRSGHA